MERVREFVVYWYFHFPKWVWTVTILVALILVHIPIGLFFPAEQLLKSDHPYHPVIRIFAFYIALIMAGGILIIVGGTLMFVVEAINSTLPDDPRKRKEDQVE